MKKLIRVDISRRQQTFVFIEIDDRDFKLQSPDVMSFARERVENDKFWDEASYDTEIDKVTEVKNADGYDIEYMPKPFGWRLKRIQEALADWEHVAQLELVEDRWLHRVAVVNDMRFRSVERVDVNEYISAIDEKFAFKPLAVALQDTFKLSFDPERKLADAFS